MHVDEEFLASVAVLADSGPSAIVLRRPAHSSGGTDNTAGARRAKYARKCKENEKLKEQIVCAEKGAERSNLLVAVMSRINPCFSKGRAGAVKLNPQQTAIVEIHAALRPPVSGDEKYGSMRYMQDKSAAKTASSILAIQDRSVFDQMFRGPPDVAPVLEEIGSVEKISGPVTKRHRHLSYQFDSATQRLQPFHKLGASRQSRGQDFLHVLMQSGVLQCFERRG